MKTFTRVVSLATDPDTTDYSLVAEPAGLFIPDIAYAGAEVIRRLRAWQQAQPARWLSAALEEPLL